MSSRNPVGWSFFKRTRYRRSLQWQKLVRQRENRARPPLSPVPAAVEKRKILARSSTATGPKFFLFFVIYHLFFLSLFFSWLFNYLADAAPNWAQHGPPRQLSPETATSAVASEAKVHQRIGTTVRYYINRLTNPRLQTVAVTFLQLKSEKRKKKGASIGPGWYLDISQISVAGLACPLIAPATRQQGENRCREKANGQVLYQITNGWPWGCISCPAAMNIDLLLIELIPFLHNWIESYRRRWKYIVRSSPTDARLFAPLADQSETDVCGGKRRREFVSYKTAVYHFDSRTAEKE